MPKPRSGRPDPDPMARAVDRLLAQLPGLRDAPDLSPTTARRLPSDGGTASEARRFQAPTLGEMIGLWTRVVLGFALGTMIVFWPYTKECGQPLFGYLGAVAMVTVAGGWGATAAWKLRAALPHILSLILMFWGLVLAAEQVLPRIGYSVDRATWQCEEPVSVSVRLISAALLSTMPQATQSVRISS